MYLWAYNQGSVSAANLANELDIPKIKHRNSRFVGDRSKVVINWGASTVPDEVARSTVLNQPDHVRIASNKLATFNVLVGRVDIPIYTESRNIARSWLLGGNIVVGRQILNGHSGNGIVIYDPNEDGLTRFDETTARMYTQYIKKQDEFRVHVVNNQVIDVQRKGLSTTFRGRDDINWRVRNLANGFVYVRSDVTLPDRVHRMAIESVNTLGLNFGAVDIIYNSRADRYFVLEVNTAPGLVGQTVVNYANAFRSM